MLSTLSIEHFNISESMLHEMRTELYHSKGPGYYIIKNFVNSHNASYMKDIWVNLDPKLAHTLHPGKDKIYLGCPNYYTCDQLNNRAFHNFLWTQPFDELTYNIAIYVQIIRNLIEGRNFSDYLFTYFGQSVSYRVAITKHGDMIVPPHRDYYEEKNKFSKFHDATRLQGTIFLSKNGVDYEGEGFKLERNSGEQVIFGMDVAVEPGDLVLWRYQNKHSVSNIRSKKEQAGFVRVLFPPEFIHSFSESRKNQILNPIKKIIPAPIKSVLKKMLGV